MKKSSIQNGLFLGVAMIICSYVLYLANPHMFLTAKSGALFLIFLLIMTKSGLDSRKLEGGFIGFKNVFFNMFITGAIGGLEDENFASLGNTIKNYMVRLVFPVALFSAIIGLFIKRDGPINPIPQRTSLLDKKINC